VHSSCPLARGYALAARDTAPKSGGRRNGSQLTRFPRLEIGTGFSDECIKLSCLEISGNLLVPALRIILNKPRTELGKLFGR
jgi:hypothetical protein